MQPFTFDPSQRGALYRYVHAPGEAVTVVHANWPVLTSQWPADARTTWVASFVAGLRWTSWLSAVVAPLRAAMGLGPRDLSVVRA